MRNIVSPLFGKKEYYALRKSYFSKNPLYVPDAALHGLGLNNYICWLIQ